MNSQVIREISSESHHCSLEQSAPDYLIWVLEWPIFSISD